MVRVNLVGELIGRLSQVRGGAPGAVELGCGHTELSPKRRDDK